MKRAPTTNALSADRDTTKKNSPIIQELLEQVDKFYLEIDVDNNNDPEFPFNEHNGDGSCGDIEETIGKWHALSPAHAYAFENYLMWTDRDAISSDPRQEWIRRHFLMGWVLGQKTPPIDLYKWLKALLAQGTTHQNLYTSLFQCSINRHLLPAIKVILDAFYKGDMELIDRAIYPCFVSLRDSPDDQITDAYVREAIAQLTSEYYGDDWSDFGHDWTPPSWDPKRELIDYCFFGGLIGGHWYGNATYEEQRVAFKEHGRLPYMNESDSEPK